MSSERVRLRLEDIPENVDRVIGYVSGVDFAVYERDTLIMDAVERCLMRVTEAVIQIGEGEAERIGLGVPWHKVRALANKSRHEYRRINPREVFDKVCDDLPPLREAAAPALES